MSEALIQIRRAANSMQLQVEEILSWLSEDPSVGDEGVAEAVISAENAVILLQGRLSKRFG